MYKDKSLLKDKFSLVVILSLVFLVFGIGLISWAFINIGLQSVNSAYDYSRSADDPITFEEKQAARLTKVDNNDNKEDSTVPAESSNASNASAIPDASEVLYPVYPAKGDNIGSLLIPLLKQKLPIIQGTDEEELKKGVGHFIQSVLPGEEDNCVLSGHRDTVFSELGKLKIGDQLIVQTSAGTFTYEIKHIRIVDKNDKTVIIPTDHAVLTLATCYPFHFVGSAPDRYIISADLVISK
jgi:sortase A